MKVPCGDAGHFAIVGTISTLTPNSTPNRALYDSNQRDRHLLDILLNLLAIVLKIVLNLYCLVCSKNLVNGHHQKHNSYY